ncbi:MAG: class I SAM-dependent methyltransferase [Geminicoccaceae bacterium]
MAWNASAPHHRDSARYRRLLNGFATPGYFCLDEILTERLLALDLHGRDVAQLCCNNGCELLSVKNLGAARCVGFDQAGGFLEQAESLRAAGSIDCDFVETDVNQIGASYDGSFDIVLITIGVFGWMPDLEAFVAVASRLLRRGGAVCIYEQHPIINMMEPYEVPDDPARLIHSYFRTTPFVEEGIILYDGTFSSDGPRKYWFVHTLADIISAFLAERLAIETFQEFPHNISSAEFNMYNDQPAQLPQSYLLVARRAA